MKKSVRRISKSRVNSYLRHATAKLTQEEKLAVKITIAEAELNNLREKKVSSLVLRVHENNLRRLNSELISVRTRRMEAERLFENAVKHNNKLNGGEESSSLVIV
jgi:hypothetical protein